MEHPPSPSQSAERPRTPDARLGSEPLDERLQEWAFTQHPCALAVFDADLRLVRANPGMTEGLGLADTPARGLRLPDIVPGPTGDAVEAALRLALGTGERQDTQLPVPPSAGTRRPAGRPATATPLRDPDGQVRGVCLVAHHTAEQAPATQRKLLLDDATRIGTTLNISHTAQELAEVAVPRLADYAAVDLLDLSRHSDTQPGIQPGSPLTLSRAAARSTGDNAPYPAPSPGESLTCPPHSPVAEALAQRRPALYDTSDDAITRWIARDPQAAWIHAAQAHSLMIVPLHARGTTLGVVLFARGTHPGPFTPDDLKLAEQLTTHTAISIANARRYTRERTTTMTLQRSLLPHTLPHQAALDIATRYLPAGGDTGVGGDWFDVIPLSGARVALVVGDVAGHGIRASATMGRLRTAVRTLADVDLPPDELLTHLDDLVIHLSTDTTPSDDTPETESGVGTTCLYAIYDPTSRHCTFARAGHPPPAIVNPDSTVYFLDVPAGPPLGLGGLPFETTDIELPEGTLLTLYTNGLLQPQHQDIDDTLDKMFTTLARPTAALDTLADRLLTTLLTRPPSDDIALLLARTRVLGTEQIATWTLPDDPAIVAEARHHATDQLSAWQLPDATYITELIVSELVTNAIRYGAPPIQLRLIHHDNTLTTEVSDTSSTTPHLRRARTYDEGGRGLLLIAQLAHRWGTRHAPAGKTIWTEQTLSTSPGSQGP
ncbi:SpoIIE family protein phosphatase [Streptomyces sp. NPDC019396]|uniref:SpoIIE family protein phosphatase n=1 Tax=Streptomyces sp. NPDC019396 TaxID=3154687 RepID=UPI0033E048A8